MGIRQQAKFLSCCVIDITKLFIRQKYTINLVEQRFFNNAALLNFSNKS
ncbi:MAG: hypothetical protein ACJAUT_001033 [Cellvibrionaceae bacterium]|jgi:hypothetical protein